MAKQITDASTLPTLEDFTEQSLLSSESVKAAAAKAAADAAGKNGNGTTTPPAVDQVATAAATLEKKKQDDAASAVAQKAGGTKLKKQTADQTTSEISEEVLTALKAKADTDITKLTEEEAEILIKAGYLEDENAPKETIWDDVAKINGINLDVDFGDTDPESAEGIALRDQVLVDHTIDNYLEYLKNNFPESYRLLEHESNGGDIKELFNARATDYNKIQLKADDVDMQKQILTEFYKAKGFDDKRIVRMIEADEDSTEGLFAAAKEALVAQQAFQKQKEDQIMLTTQQQQQAKAARDEQVRSIVKDITNSGQIGNFQLAPKDRQAFYDFALNNVFSDGKDGYQVVLPINDKTLVPVLQQLLFTYKNGDLSEFVKRQAATESVRKLKRKVAQDTSRAGSVEDTTQSKVKKLPTLEAFNA